MGPGFNPGAVSVKDSRFSLAYFAVDGIWKCCISSAGVGKGFSMFGSKVSLLLTLVGILKVVH